MIDSNKCSEWKIGVSVEKLGFHSFPRRIFGCRTGFKSTAMQAPPRASDSQQSPNFYTDKEPRKSLASRYDKFIPNRFLAPTDCLFSSSESVQKSTSRNSLAESQEDQSMNQGHEQGTI